MKKFFWALTHFEEFAGGAEYHWKKVTRWGRSRKHLITIGPFTEAEADGEVGAKARSEIVQKYRESLYLGNRATG